MSETTLLFRPVGQAEYQLVLDSGFRAFPPKLPEQSYFYPVTSLEYATQIARDWNTKDSASGFVGYVLQFAVRTEYLQNFPVRQVGDVMHREYWIPASELPRFNRNIVGPIAVLQRYPAS
jgi:hypothetical protein